MDKIRIKEEIHYKMGSRHPMSLRLKKSSYWGNTSYYFNSKNEQHNYWGVDKIALNVIKHYFQFALISKPKFNKDSNKIVISFYYFLKDIHFIWNLKTIFPNCFLK